MYVRYAKYERRTETETVSMTAELDREEDPLEVIKQLKEMVLKCVDVSKPKVEVSE